MINNLDLARINIKVDICGLAETFNFRLQIV